MCHKKLHRSTFNCNDNNQNVVDESKLSKTESKCLTNETWLSIVFFLSKWKDADQLKSLSNNEDKEYNAFKDAHLEELKRDRKEFNCSKLIHALEDGQLKNREIMKQVVRIETDRENSDRHLVVPFLVVFYIINDAHSSLGHMGGETLFYISKKYYRISQTWYPNLSSHTSLQSETTCYECH